MQSSRRSLPLTGLMAVVTLMLVVAIASITQQFAGATENRAEPRAEIATRCDGDVLRVHVLLYDDGSAPTRFTVTSRVGDGPTVAADHDVAGSDVEILEFEIPTGVDGTFRITNDDDPSLDRRRQPVSECARPAD